MRLHEAKELESEVTQTKLVEEAICLALSMVTESHVWHWQTKTLASHTALGDYSNFVQSKVDQLAESFMGCGGTVTFRQHGKIDNFKSEEQVKEGLTKFKERLVQAEAELVKDENSSLHPVGATILDIIEETDKLLYLLTLK